MKVSEEMKDEIDTNILIDKASLTPYGIYDYEERLALQKVLIGKPDGSGNTEDIIKHSEAIKAISKKKILRYYASDSAKLKSLNTLWGVAK